MRIPCLCLFFNSFQMILMGLFLIRRVKYNIISIFCDPKGVLYNHIPRPHNLGMLDFSSFLKTEEYFALGQTSIGCIDY